MINIISGGKTGYNLLVFLEKLGVDARLYFLPGEYSQKRKVGEPLQNLVFDDNAKASFIITSETAFQTIQEQFEDNFKIHYFLRDKGNLDNIAQSIGTSSIEELSPNLVLDFPIIAKPKESSAGKVSFKFKVIYNNEELKSINKYVSDCFLQPFLSSENYKQIAIAGYFDGSSKSLIGVEQLSQYPKGVSAYVEDKTDLFEYEIERVSNYLNQLEYRGFIEFEFKQNIANLQLFLMDINPRPWGWFYFYLSRVENFPKVLSGDEYVQLTDKKAWINTPRLIMANLKGEFQLPNFKFVIKNQLVYEPY